MQNQIKAYEAQISKDVQEAGPSGALIAKGLQHTNLVDFAIKKIMVGADEARIAILKKDTSLSNSDAVKIIQEALEECKSRC